MNCSTDHPISSATNTATPSCFPANEQRRRKVVIIGGGLVGSLAGLYFSKDDWDVEIYELRPDPRLPENRNAGEQKSINLAISERGLNSIRCVDEELLEVVLKETVPMIGRCIHPRIPSEEGGRTQAWFSSRGNLKGGGESQKYDVHGKFIRSTDRSRLNIALLDRVEQQENVKIFFLHTLKNLNLHTKAAEFEKRDTQVMVQAFADLFVGADGAHSATRRFLQRYVRMYYEQVYIDTLWCELEILPEPDTGDFKLDGNHLHIWPRGDFMFIAIPSSDRTFTCTLFMPEKYFSQISNSANSLLEFFQTHFSDVIPLIGQDKLVRDYFHNAKLPLISIKCHPYHYKDTCVILGDAAHAMVPFYGQGMNAGFEDVRVLFDHINANKVRKNLEDALSAYSKQRKEDAHTINDLAMMNYNEMANAVNSRMYKFRKGVEEFLYAYFPSLGVRTQYGMVSFSNVRYVEVKRRMEWQRRLFYTCFGVLGMGLVYLALLGMKRTRFWGPSLAMVVKAVAGLREGTWIIRL